MLQNSVVIVVQVSQGRAGLSLLAKSDSYELCIQLFAEQFLLKMSISIWNTHMTIILITMVISVAVNIISTSPLTRTLVSLSIWISSALTAWQILSHCQLCCLYFWNVGHSIVVILVIVLIIRIAYQNWGFIHCVFFLSTAHSKSWSAFLK